MADAHKYQAHEVLNRVLNAGEDGLNVDLADSVTVTVDSEFPAAAAITDNFANPTTTSAMSMIMGYDGSAWDRVTIGGGTQATALRVTIASDSSGVLSVDDNGSTLTVDVASGGIASGAIASGAVASGAVASGALASGSVVDGAMVTLGAKADAKSTATDTTAITAMQVLKQISASTQETATDTGTIDSDTNDIKTAVQLIDNAISGSEMQVDVVAALPAGTNNIGDVDVLSVIPSTGATNLGKAIQSAQGGTDTGVAALVVRNDVLADLSGADGDYAPLQVDKSGALYTIEETGQLGSLFEDGTEDITSKQIIAIQFLEDTTFTTLTPSGSSLYIGTANQDGDAITTGNVFPQGMTIFGRWTGYRLASGTIIAYKGTF